MLKWFAALLAVVWFTVAGPAHAQGKQDFTLTNKTGYAIDQVYVSPTHSDDWEEDVLGRDQLGNGESVDISFTRGTKTCKWDLKVIYDDGETAVWNGLDLCSISKVTIRWNKNTGETTAYTE